MKRLIQHTVVRYIIGGGTSAVINLSVLYFFNSVLHVYYLTASVIAYIVAFFVSLSFHKFWTFRDHSMDNLHRQSALYLLSNLFGLSLNTLILYISVDLIHAQVLVGQIVAGALVACCTFFISKHFIFNRKPIEGNQFPPL